MSDKRNNLSIHSPVRNFGTVYAPLISYVILQQFMNVSKGKLNSRCRNVNDGTS
jgi:hypothetical protein